MLKNLLYFVKYPEPGKVKTRLAKTMGNEAAARTYQLLAEHNFKAVESLDGIDTVVAFDPPDKEPFIREWLLPAAHYLPQCGDGLGDRLIHAFDWALQKPGSAAAALGSDTLCLTPEIILDAFDKLETFDTVLGPAEDGGYYLIGLRAPQPELFIDIPWSTPAVFELTLKRIREKKLSCFILEELEDLDEAVIPDSASPNSTGTLS